MIYYLDHASSGRTSVKREHPPFVLADHGVITNINGVHIEVATCYTADAATLKCTSTKEDDNDYVSTIVKSAIVKVWRWGNVKSIEGKGE